MLFAQNLSETITRNINDGILKQPWEKNSNSNTLEDSHPRTETLEELRRLAAEDEANFWRQNDWDLMEIEDSYNDAIPDDATILDVIDRAWNSQEIDQESQDTNTEGLLYEDLLKSEGLTDQRGNQTGIFIQNSALLDDLLFTTTTALKKEYKGMPTEFFHTQIHLWIIKQTLSNIKEVSVRGKVMKISPSKSNLGAASTVFLGKIFHRGVKLFDIESYKHLKLNLKLPENGAELSSFAASIRYLTDFIQNLSSLLQPINQQIKKGAGLARINYEINPQLREAIQLIKKLTAIVVGRHNLPANLALIQYILLSTDASQNFIAYTLLVKIIGEPGLKLITHYSARLTETNQNKAIWFKEFLALHLGLMNTAETLLQYRGCKIIVLLDNSPLLYSIDKIVKADPESTNILLSSETTRKLSEDLAPLFSQLDIEVKLIASKLQLSDFPSREDPRNEFPWDNEESTGNANSPEAASEAKPQQPFKMTEVPGESLPISNLIQLGNICKPDKSKLFCLAKGAHAASCRSQIKSLNPNTHPRLLPVTPGKKRQYKLYGEEKTYYEAYTPPIDVVSLKNLPDFIKSFGGPDGEPDQVTTGTSIKERPWQHFLGKEDLIKRYYQGLHEDLDKWEKETAETNTTVEVENVNKTRGSRLEAAYQEIAGIKVLEIEKNIFVTEEKDCNRYGNMGATIVLMLGRHLGGGSPKPSFVKHIQQEAIYRSARAPNTVAAPISLGDSEILIGTMMDSAQKESYKSLDSCWKLFRKITEKIEEDRRTRILVVNSINLLQKFGIAYQDQPEILRQIISGAQINDPRLKKSKIIIQMEKWKNKPEAGNLPDLVREVPLLEGSRQIGKCQIPILQNNSERNTISLRNQLEGKLKKSLRNATAITRRGGKIPLPDNWTWMELNPFALEGISIPPPYRQCRSQHRFKGFKIGGTNTETTKKAAGKETDPQESTIVPIQMGDPILAEEVRTNFSANTLLALSQRLDPAILSVINQISKKNPAEADNIYQTREKIQLKLIEGTLYGCNPGDDFKIILPAPYIMNTLMYLHGFSHEAPKKMLECLKDSFFLLPNAPATRLAKTICENCFTCIHNKNSMIHRPVPIRNLALSLAAPTHSTWEMDVMVLGPNLQCVKNVNIIICTSCGFVSAKALRTGPNSKEITKHVVEYIQVSRRIPTLLCSDAGSYQSKGEIRSFITSLQNRIDKVNKRTDATNQTINDPSELEIDDLRENLPSLERENILVLTEPQKKALKIAWEDLQSTGDPFMPYPRQSHPPPYKGNLTSQLALVDGQCAKLRKALQGSLTAKTTTAQLEYLLTRYCYHENYNKQSASTRETPAIAHLGHKNIASSKTLTALLAHTQADDTITEPSDDWTEILQEAKSDLEIRQNLQNSLAKSNDDFKRSETRIASEATAVSKLAPLGLAMVKSEKRAGKTDGTNKYVGPYVLIGASYPDKNLFLLDLETGNILKRNRSKVKSYLSAEFFTIPREYRNVLRGPYDLPLARNQRTPPENNQFFPIALPREETVPSEQQIQKHWHDLLNPLQTSNKVLRSLMELFAIIGLGGEPEIEVEKIFKDDKDTDWIEEMEDTEQGSKTKPNTISFGPTEMQEPSNEDEGENATQQEETHEERELEQTEPIQIPDPDPNQQTTDNMTDSNPPRRSSRERRPPRKLDL